MILLRRTSRVGGPFRIVVLGDSLTANVWHSQLASQLAINHNAAVADAGQPGPYKRVASATAPHLWFNSGVAGDDCTNIVGHVDTRVAVYKPDLVILFIGVNCAQHAVSGPTCTANHASILADCKAIDPTVQLLVMSPLCWGENWPDGANANDALMDAKAAICASTAAAAGATYVDLRAPMFAYEAINNPGHLTVLGPLTNNDASGIHTNQGAGVAFLRDQLLPSFTFG